MDEPVIEPEKKKGCTLTSVLIGCGVLILLGMITLGIGGFLTYRWGMQQLEDFAGEFEQQGYERVMAQMCEETEPFDEPKVYTSQVVLIKTEVDTDLAIMAQMVEIHGTVNGDIDFLGQILSIKPGGRVDGDIRCKNAQVLVIEGELTGQVTGKYQTLNWPNKPAGDAPVEEIPAETAPVENSEI